MARPLNHFSAGKELEKVVREAVRAAVNHERAIRGQGETSMSKVGTSVPLAILTVDHATHSSPSGVSRPLRCFVRHRRLVGTSW